MDLKYHQKTFDLLDRQAHTFPAAPIELTALAAEIGHPLAPSLREWYSIEHSDEILNELSNDDHPISLERLGRSSLTEARLSPDAIHSSRLLKIMIENQGVCCWAVKLDDSDDPPVFVRMDEADALWQPAAERFSDFIYSWAWDAWSLGHDETAYVLSCIHTALGKNDLAYFQANFSEEISTSRFDKYTDYRFFRDNQKIYIRSGTTQTDWFVMGKSLDALYVLARTICAI